jgi:hypothetical protein
MKTKPAGPGNRVYIPMNGVFFNKYSGDVIVCLFAVHLINESP